MVGESCERLRSRWGMGLAAISAICAFAAGLAAPEAVARGAGDAGHRRDAHAAAHRRRPNAAHAGRAKANAGRAKRKHRGKATRRHSGKSGERNLEASINLRLSPPEPSLPQVQTINLFVPEGFRDAGRKLPFCTIAVLREKKPEKCPKDSVVGSGTSLGYVFFSDGEYVPEHLALTMFNGPGGGLLTWIEGSKPVNIEELVAGVITAPKDYGQELAFTIPNGLLEPLPGAHGWLVELNATLSGKVGWLRTTSCPPHPWTLAAAFGYTNGQGIAVKTKLACM